MRKKEEERIQKEMIFRQDLQYLKAKKDREEAEEALNGGKPMRDTVMRAITLPSYAPAEWNRKIVEQSVLQMNADCSACIKVDHMLDVALSEMEENHPCELQIYFLVKPGETVVEGRLFKKNEDGELEQVGDEFTFYKDNPNDWGRVTHCRLQNDWTVKTWDGGLKLRRNRDH